MAKVKGQQNTPRRETRKEFLLTRQQQEQYQKIRLAVIGIVGLLAVILIAGLVFEYVVKPGQPVATVNGEDILLRDWKRRVSYERLEGIENIESFYEAVGGNVQQLQQFAGQQLTALVYPSVQGEQTLTTMINEKLIEQEAANRGISVSDAEIESRIAERFNYFDGAAPTATPAPTQTPVPTPSITPIGATDSAEEEVVEEVVTQEPEPEVQPTAVSRESFDTSYNEALEDFASSGATETDYRDAVKAEIYREKLQESFSADSDLPTEEENVDFFMMQFSDEAEASIVAAQIASGSVDYITAWNTLRSAEFVTSTQGTANDYQWTPISAISSSLGTEVAEAMSTIELDTPSGVLAGQSGGFFIVQIRDRAMQPIPDGSLSGQASTLLQEWLDEQRLDVVIFERWSDNIPTRPILDPKYYTEAPVTEIEDAVIEPTAAP